MESAGPVSSHSCAFLHHKGRGEQSSHSTNGRASNGSTADDSGARRRASGRKSTRNGPDGAAAPAVGTGWIRGRNAGHRSGGEDGGSGSRSSAGTGRRRRRGGSPGRHRDRHGRQRLTLLCRNALSLEKVVEVAAVGRDARSYGRDELALGIAGAQGDLSHASRAPDGGERILDAGFLKGRGSNVSLQPLCVRGCCS